MQTAEDELTTKARAAKEAAREVARLTGKVKDRALLNIADRLKSRQEEVLQANEKDCEAGRRNGLSEALLDRLLLTPERLEGVADDVRNVVMLPDPVGEVLDMRTMTNGLQVGRAPRAPRCRRRHLREPTQRHGGHLRVMPEIWQRHTPERR